MGSSIGVYRILVADADIMVGQFRRNALTQLGHFVDLAQDAKDVRRKLQEGNLDVLITDLELPDGSGLDILREARAGGKQVGVILTSVRSSLEAEQACRDFERVKFLRKPFGLTELYAALDDVGGTSKS